MIRFGLALAILALPAPALAQAYQCRVPEQIALPAPVQPDGPTVRGAITGYTLALSWSPEYCRGKAGQTNDYQCGGGIGRFGFVLHGLWPDARGRAPQWCALAPRPGAEEIKANLCMTPVPWLLEHEWAKHGSCMAKTPRDYFAAEQRLWQGLTMPDADRLSRRKGLTAGDLRAAFAQLNPGIPASSIGLLVSNGGWLREVRVCYSAAMRPAACSKRTFGPKNAVPLKIWRGL
ncbi:MAG: ribonuclease T [Novosphingobium sp.]|uniref:ribonuclease T2 family protein n=1 Tax=Novosphingobium sp. TaxID=1874826 RepID=UPI001DF4CC4D|nr:ribonuclease T [Novosphingobium sp.]MCB2057102.1 ribonuclease T [Novosphingobium sp.]MCP5387082.1 ribonuclease T [Novosphingobium sp.]HNN55119.1 ribonuclease T [Novosphingobium sp.]